MEDQILTDTVENGTIENVHIAPIGEFTGSDADGKPIPESITAEALQKLADELNSTDAEVLADVDHGASKPGVQRDTKAAGWFTKFIVDPIKGLFANLKLTKHGKELLENREYRYISPTFSLDEDGRPISLHTASLTNLPAFAGHIEPVLNQEAQPISEDKGKMKMELTKEELVDLIKETVKAMNEETVEEVKEETAEEVKEEKKEETVDNGCADEEKVENGCSEQQDEVKNENVDEEKKEEKKEEVIKIEALNSAPTAFKDVDNRDWMNLHGKEFFDYLAKHPEIRG